MLEMARLEPARRDRAQRRRLDPATLRAPGATVVEGATRGQTLHVGRLPRYRAQLRDADLVEPRRRAQQSLRVRMLRVVEDLAHRRLLDDPPAVHDEHA